MAALGLYAVITGLSLIQQPGKTTYDTRAEMTERPLSFFREAFTLWHPESNLGEFQNQAYGYLFPQGTWFFLTDLLRVPDWTSQRLWTALVLIVACEGARRVASAVGLPGGAALVAGLAFAFSPRLLGTVGVISAESLPGAVMPWVVLPVLLALNGRLAHRHAAILSGAAVVCMGGVNAVENAGSLPLAAVLVLWGWRRDLVPARFVGEWGLAVVVAAFWWAFPLLVLAGYSPPFYEYVESSSNTTAVVGWSEAVRGDSHWVAYLVTGDRPWWPAAHFLVSDRLMVLVAAVVTAIGLLGLVALRSALRVPLALAAVLGLTALTIAHGGWEGSPLSGAFLWALDGPLQIFRNVHKIDPIVRLPVAIGFGNAAGLGAGWLITRWPRMRPTYPLLLGVPACLALVLGQPFLVNNVRTPGWTDVDPAWVQARDYLAEHQGETTALVVPGAGFAQQSWGWTMDEPLQVLGGVNRVARSQVPLIPGPSIRYLSGLDRVITNGRGTNSLASQLARAGIGHVVIRRDLEREYTLSPPPGGSTASVNTGGLERVAAFGPLSDGAAMIEIYEVPDADAQARTNPVDNVLTVAGAPESILDLQDEGLVGAEQATVLAGEPGWRRQPDIVTDADQRRERAFGFINEALSSVLTADEKHRNSRAVHDYPTVPHAKQVVAEYDGLSGLTASSSQGYADTFGSVTPQNGPYSAIDGDPDTRWVSSPTTDPRTQWLRLEFPEPRVVRKVTVRPVVGDSEMVPIRSLEVVAGGQEVDLDVNPSGARLTAEFDGRPVRSVEVRVTNVRSAEAHGQVAIADLTVDDLEPRRTLRLPYELGPEAIYLFETEPPRRACTTTLDLPDCDTRRIRASEEPDGMDRTFTMPLSADVSVQGQVVARSTLAARRLLEPEVVGQRVGSSSVYGDDPQVSSRFAYDGSATTAWISADEDPSPTLTFEWDEPKTITDVTIDVGSGPSSSPARAVLKANGESQELFLGGDFAPEFEPVTARRVQISFAPRPGSDHVQVAEIQLEGARVTRPFAGSTATGSVCGFGPNVFVGDQQVKTRVVGTMADIVNGTPMRFVGCADAGTDTTFELDRGTHRMTAPPNAEFDVIRVSGSGERATVDGSDVRSIEVKKWEATQRVVELGPGGDSVLSVPENFNAGWVAHLGDQKLTPLRVDGWQQAWLVPAGNTGEIRLEYAPQPLYSLLLPLGLALSGLVLVAGLVLLVRRPQLLAARDWPNPAPVSAGGIVLSILLGLALMGGVASAGLAAGLLLGRSARKAWLPLGVLAAALVVASGVVDVLDVLDSSAWEHIGDACAAAAVGVFVGLAAGRVRPAPRPAADAPSAEVAGR